MKHRRPGQETFKFGAKINMCACAGPFQMGPFLRDELGPESLPSASPALEMPQAKPTRMAGNGGQVRKNWGSLRPVQ